MLIELLELIAKEGMRQPSELASVMGVSTSLLESMLADLERMGYLEKLDAICETGCKNCPSKCVMSVMNAPRVWKLTDKGRRAAAPASGSF